MPIDLLVPSAATFLAIVCLIIASSRGKRARNRDLAMQAQRSRGDQPKLRLEA